MFTAIKALWGGLAGKVVLVGLVAAAVECGGLYWLYTGESAKVDKQNIALGELRGEVTTLTANGKLQVAATEACNASIDGYKAIADKRVADAEAEVNKAKANRPKVEQHINTILTDQRPQGMNACDAANKAINDEILYLTPQR